jgi:hypothetical protein
MSRKNFKPKQNEINLVNIITQLDWNESPSTDISYIFRFPKSRAGAGLDKNSDCGPSR